MLTQQENETLTRIGPGTPAGELLRRYWHPISVVSELTEENPTKLIRIFGETLVLFRDKSGRIGLIEDRCAHRGASMFYGRVEERGIACPYHGWLYDTDGQLPGNPRRAGGEQISSHDQSTRLTRCRSSSACIGRTWARPRAGRFRSMTSGCAKTAGGESLFTRSSTATGSRRWRTPSTPRTCRCCTRHRSPATGRSPIRLGD